MPEDDQPEKVWDEYDWERFLQQQDRKTEKYMELLERYIDDPNRDQIIAREMGWNHLLNKEGRDWADHVDSQFSAEGLDEEEKEEEGGKEHAAFGFEVHPLYQAAFTLAAWIDQMFEECDVKVENHPAAVNLSTQAALASAKLAAALSDDDIDEIGMTIAYLKRALRASPPGSKAPRSSEGERDRRRAFRRAQPAAFPRARRHHHAHGRFPGRMAPSFPALETKSRGEDQIA